MLHFCVSTSIFSVLTLYPQVVSKLLSLFSDEAYSQLLDWIYKFSRNTKISYRVFALDLISELLGTQRRTPTEGIILQWSLLIECLNL